MQGKAEEDNLQDYNEDPEYANMGNTGKHPSHTPPQTPTGLTSDDSEGEVNDENESDLEKGQEVEMDSSSTQQALVERRQREFDILSTKLEDNG
jgi:hypothetical protein